MIKNLNNKGFTLIELLATIVILAVLSTVTIVTIVSYHKNSKEKAEEAFVNQVENYIENYISFTGSKLTYDKENGELKEKCNSSTSGECRKVTLYTALDSEEIEYVSNVFASRDLINPSTEEKCTNDNTKLKIFRDTDFVYCFKLEKVGDTSCIDDNIDTCDAIFNDISG